HDNTLILANAADSEVTSSFLGHLVKSRACRKCLCSRCAVRWQAARRCSRRGAPPSWRRPPSSSGTSRGPLCSCCSWTSGDGGSGGGGGGCCGGGGRSEASCEMSQTSQRRGPSRTKRRPPSTPGCSRCASVSGRVSSGGAPCACLCRAAPRSAQTTLLSSS
uniref:Uncharacterized protein n=1 Tax=Gasterosteus aculeatus TaxID=69293 RepID=G3PQ14_GASAC